MKTLAAHTPTGGYTYYPPYINIGQHNDGKITVTLRGNEYPDGKCGATNTATFDAEQFKAFVAEAAAAFGLSATHP